MDRNARTLIDLALAEDIGDGDVTSRYFVPEDRVARAFIVARTEGVISGAEVAQAVFRTVDASLDTAILVPDGSRVSAGAMVLRVEGSARSILTAERTALNFLQRLSGVATLTRRYVDAISGTGAAILDTRKTTPGYRTLEKAAVVHGGGTNHRLGLFDRAMVKDNHLVAENSLSMLQEAIAKLKADRPGVEVELEADRLEQVEAFLGLDGVDYLLLDNMPLDGLRAAVAMRNGRTIPRLEASGGVNLETVRGIAGTGVDFVSVGALTHSAPSLDLGLDFVPVP
ncbi:MAG TPA: carboxylating nicotinate-nucleotide diphosphorylase [Luteolibacter sp.]